MNHEKEHKQEGEYKIIHPSLHLSTPMLYKWKNHFSEMKGNVGMSVHEKEGGHLLVPLLFHELTSLHSPSFQRNDFSTCSTYFFIWGKAPIIMECR